MSEQDPPLLPRPNPVFLTRLALEAFRNHAMTEAVPGTAPMVVLTGANGAGKTNILEAISLFAVGRGLRGVPPSRMAAAHGPGHFQLKADILSDPGLPAVELWVRTQAKQPDRRILRVNGVQAALSTLSDWASILWLTPAMDRLFQEPASSRRRFLDRFALALFPGHAGHATRYEAAMRARNRLLTDERPPDPAWLSTLEAEMATHGAALTDARRETVAALQEMLVQAASADFPRATISLVDGMGEDGAGQDFARMLREGRRRDAAAGRTLVGPHRADLEVLHTEKAMPAALASTGEQKALLIGILLAHAALVAGRTGRTPLLLLDEVVAHLDPDRQQALFGRLTELGGQSWMTGTEARLFAGLDAAFYQVAAGTVTSSGR